MTDPAGIPPRVLAAAYIGQGEGGMPGAIAAAVDVLLDDEPLRNFDIQREDGMFDVVQLRPSDVLAAVLARESSVE